MKYLLKVGNSLFFVLTIFWVYFSLYFLFQYLNFDYTNLNSTSAKFLLFVLLVLFLFFHFSNLLKKIFLFCMKHKYSIFVPMLMFQLLITLTSLSLAVADTEIVYNIATNLDFSKSTDYISFNPNNFLLVVWFKLNYFFAGENLLFVLAIWNIIFIDLSIWFVYRTNKLILNDRIADTSFLLMSLIIGFSPQYIYTYSDPVTLFLLSCFIFLFVSFVLNQNKVNLLLSGLVLALAFGFRPTVAIFIIAIVIVGTLFSMKKQFSFKKNWKLLSFFLAAFTCITVLISVSLNSQSIIKYESDKNRTMLYYVDLGLTYTGNIHADLSEEVFNSTGADRNKLAMLEIQKRLSEYSPTTFVGHLFYKYYWMTGEGMFGWFPERVLKEERRPSIDWLNSIQSTTFAKWIRTYVYVEGSNYIYYALVMQLVWIVLSFGLARYPFVFSDKNWYLLWMQISIFGGLLFLFIFEAGRTRYLIQFLPAIITISSTGLDSILSKKFSRESLE